MHGPDATADAACNTSACERTVAHCVSQGTLQVADVLQLLPFVYSLTLDMPGLINGQGKDITLFWRLLCSP